MSQAPSEIIFRKGLPPEARKYPGHGYRSSLEQGMIVKRGVPVPVEIEIWPSGTRFSAGEKLRVVVQGSDIYKYAQWIRLAGHPETRNAGQHVIHTGGKYDSHLLVPVIPPKN